MRRRLGKSQVKAQGSTLEKPAILPGLRAEEAGGIPGVGVKSVDIGRNTGGEAGQLDGS